MQEEIWKDVPNYEGIYQVSNLGRVKSMPRKMIKGRAVFISKEKQLKFSLEGGGYHQVMLCNGHKKIHKVHKLVAITFLNHVPSKYKIIVDHINNNKLDNRLENLQLISQRENTSKDRKNGASRYIGVTWNKKRNKWQAQIIINNKNINLGCYINEYDAHLAYQNKLKEINETY